ncbi:MAG: aldehyde ferredoxin oxidoreductase [Clostridiales bacterium]|nr:aldehyde ferredoxin oxidoreductase [Clostridiales bacterium]MBQ3322737.1 aldehyde ferredoxin oxidoreductase family protein [Bacillota bacterium]
MKARILEEKYNAQAADPNQNIMSAYQNKVLRINLAEEDATIEPLRMDFADKYVGSKGLAIRYMYEDMKPGIDPLGPENNLYFTTGPMTATPIPCSGKLSVAAKSPATGTMNDCSIGGHIGIRLKFAGYDIAVFEGQSEKPVYVVIEDDEITFHDASHLWGKTSHQAEKELIDEYGTEYSCLSIGPAGENLNLISCINCDYYRQAGRGGIGAVMGSKKVKAILVKGTLGVKVPNIKETTDRILEILHENALSEDNEYVFDEGTYAFLEACNDGGILPAHNFSAATDVKWDQYNGAVMKKYRLGKRGCGSCALGCGNFMQVGDAIVEGPEYETTAASGPQCDIASIEHNVKYNQLVDDLGMDSISTGVTVAWAMEMAEKGIHDFGVHFGNEEEMLKLIEDMAYRRGAGAELADGVKVASEKWGGTDFAMHSKGLEFPQYEPRGSFGMAASYAVSDRGACHMRSYTANSEVFEAAVPPYTHEGKGQVLYDLGEWNAIKFSCCLCDLWGTADYAVMSELLTLITGKEWTEEDMSTVGRRVLNIGRAFNQREGFTREHDVVPQRLFKDKLKGGPADGQVMTEEGFQDMLDQYYEIMGWDKNGCLPQELLDTL